MRPFAMKAAFMPLALLLATLACGEPTAPPAPTRIIHADATSAPLPRGDRLLGIDVTQAADEDFDQAFRVARAAGLQFASLSIAWDDLEPRSGEYTADPNWLAIANSYYAAEHVPLALTVSPIDTNRVRLPEDLRGRDFNDPEVIARFERLLDYVFTQVPEVDLTVLAIGNEVDATLGADVEAWEQYTEFVNAAAAHARTARPGLRVGVKLTMSGLAGETLGAARALNEQTDIILVTYYPLRSDFGVRQPSVVPGDFATIASSFPSRPIGFLEVGCPSSERLGSSEALQAEFVRYVFEAWDAHAGQIELLNFTWLTDAPEASVDEWSDYYGLRDDRFAAYLSSLGLRQSDGTAKVALDVLAAEARARGW